jgi:hypothetical protein
MLEQENHPHLWERYPEENARWYGRFLLYRDLGPSRTLLGAVTAEKAQKSPKKPNKNVPGAWKDACEQWNWKGRAEAWDAWERKRIEAKRQAYVDGIMQDGYALVHERVKSLYEVALQLRGYIEEPGKVFLPDVKQIGFGEFAERVDLITFNDALFEQYRKYVADIAAETGGRAKVTKSDITSNGEKLEGTKVIFYVPEVDRDEQEDEVAEAGTAGDGGNAEGTRGSPTS